jgi:acyl-CoA synthetase (AMP-forming)/AMP-acid ligase II
VPFSELATTGDTARSPRGGSPEQLAYAIYTSGTTGSPKGVLISRGAFAAAVRATAEALGLDRGTRTLCVSPFHFDGSFGTLFPTLFVGGAVVLRPRESLLFPRTFFRAVEREGITYTGFSPSYLKLLLASPQLSELAAGTLETIALGGEAASLADIRALWAAAPRMRIVNRYGPTETTIAVTHIELTPELVADGTVPIGIPHTGVHFSIVDEVGRIVDEADTVGELYIGGNQLMTGYWGAPELTADVLRTDVVPGETVYRTGDLVYRNGHGHYVYVERADRVIKRSGVRISLVELADAVREQPGVTDAACVVFDREGEVGIAAFVVADRPLTVLELRQGAGRRLPDSMLPDRVELVDELPLTSASKLDERQLLRRVGLLPPGTSTGTGTGTGTGSSEGTVWRSA